MTLRLTFLEAQPGDIAARLDAQSVHLWRFPYVPSQGRAPLLSLLAAYLGRPAAAVLLDEGPHGKPRLVHPSGTPNGGIEFNWSHSSGYALVAVARGTALGVDIERTDRKPRALEIARRFFGPAEADALAAVHPAARNHAFISLWCAKEAMLKAAGEGLSFGLARLTFARDDLHDWRLVCTDPALGNPAHWQLAAFEPVPGYRGALAWRGNARAIRAFCR